MIFKWTVLNRYKPVCLKWEHSITDERLPKRNIVPRYKQYTYIIMFVFELMHIHNVLKNSKIRSHYQNPFKTFEYTFRILYLYGTKQNQLPFCSLLLTTAGLYRTLDCFHKKFCTNIKNVVCLYRKLPRGD